MALRTAIQNGLWSDPAVWGGTVPVNGDTVATDSSSRDVTFDVDQSGFAAGIGASTWNGILRVSNTPGAYTLKLSGTWTWGASAQFICNNGTIGQPLPANVTFTMAFNGTFQNTFAATTVRDLRCQEPARTYVNLSQAESAGATVLHVDADITGEALYWKTGDIIRIDNINRAVQTEERVIQSVTSSTITITAGLTASKLSGSYVFIISRNVKFLGLSGAPTAFANGNGGVARGEFRNLGNVASGGATQLIGSEFGGTASSSVANANVFNGGLSPIWDGVVSGKGFLVSQTRGARLRGVFSALAGGFSNGYSYDCDFNGLITGLGTVVNGEGTAGASCTFSGSIRNSSTVFSRGGGFILRDLQLVNNATDVTAVGDFVAYNCLFGGATEFASYNSAFRLVWNYAESFDHDQVAGAYRNWCRGGITSDDAVTVYPGRTRSYKHVLEIPVIAAETSYSFRDQLVLVPAGATLTVTSYLRKDASMTYRPRVQIFDAGKEPLRSGSADAESVMTDSVDTWEVLTVSLTNSASYAKPCKVRVIGSNASGNVYEDTIISTGGGIAKLIGGGLVS